MNIKRFFGKTISTLAGVAVAAQSSILAKAGAADEILNSSKGTDSNGLINMDGSNAEEVVNSILNPPNNAAANEQALGDVREVITTYGSAGVSITQLIFMYAVIISLLITFISLLINAGKAAEVANTKVALVLRILAGVAGFGVVGMVVVLMKVGYHLF